MTKLILLTGHGDSIWEAHATRSLSSSITTTTMTHDTEVSTTMKGKRIMNHRADHEHDLCTHDARALYCYQDDVGQRSLTMER